MSTIKTIRERLGLTQAALAEGMGCTQGNVGHYEKGQTVPPDAAKRLITFARTLGHEVSYEDIYGSPEAVGQAGAPEVAAKAEV
jgi:putative transcriptional regulator